MDTKTLRQNVEENLKKLNEACNNGFFKNLQYQISKNSIHLADADYDFDFVRRMFPDFNGFLFNDTNKNLNKLKSFFELKELTQHPYSICFASDDWGHFSKVLTKTGESFLIQEIQKLLNTKITRLDVEWCDDNISECYFWQCYIETEDKILYKYDYDFHQSKIKVTDGQLRNLYFCKNYNFLRKLFAKAKFEPIKNPDGTIDEDQKMSDNSIHEINKALVNKNIFIYHVMLSAPIEDIQPYKQYTVWYKCEHFLDHPEIIKDKSMFIGFPVEDVPVEFTPSDLLLNFYC